MSKVTSLQRAQSEAAGDIPPPRDGRSAVNYGELVRLLHQASTRPRSAHGVMAPVLTSGELISLLSSIQEQSCRRYPVAGKPLAAWFISAVHEGVKASGRTMARRDEDNLTLVAMLFEVLLDDRRLPADMRRLLARLQIPMLQMAVADRSVFVEVRHPARILLNEIFRAVLAGQADDEIIDDPLLRQLRTIVEQMTVVAPCNSKLCNALLLSFRSYLAREQRQFQRLEHRLEEAAKAREKTAWARQSSRLWLDKAVAGRALSPALQTLLEQGMLRALFLACLRGGTDSVEWHRVTTLVNSWLSCQDNGAEPDAALLEQSADSLQEAGLDAVSIEQLLAAMLAASASANVGLVPWNATGDHCGGQEATAASAVTHTQGQQHTGRKDRAAADHDVARITPGTWIQLRTAGGRRLQCRLAMVLYTSDTYLFVSRTGQRALECSHRELVETLRDGGIEILDDTEMFEFALAAVKGRLRQRSKHPALSNSHATGDWRNVPGRRDCGS